MNREAELRQLYQEKLEPELKKTEKERQEQLKSYRLEIGIFILFVIAMFFPTSLLPIDNKMIFIFVIFIIGAVIVSINAPKRKAYTQNFKIKIIQEILRFINPNYKYNPKGFIKNSDYCKSGLYLDGITYEGEDYVTGFVGKTPFQFSELNVYSKSDKSTTVYFKGIFFIADFNKHLQAKTFVFPEKSKTNILNQEKKNLSDSKLVSLENPEFESIFSVYGTSQQEARYILSPAIMEAMVAVYKKYNLKMSFSFIGANMYCGMETGRKNYFEPNLKGYGYEDIEETVRIFGLIETIITEMNLNTRIWTKK